MGQGRTPEGLGFRSSPDEGEGRCKRCVYVREKERENLCLAKINKGLPYSSSGKESVCNAGNQGSRLGSGRSPGAGNGNPLQYSCLENSMDREAWRVQSMGLQRVGHDLVTEQQQRKQTLVCALG